MCVCVCVRVSCVQDARLAADIESRGVGSLEQRTVTVCSGLDFVNITYNNFVARNENVANVCAFIIVV